LVLFKTTLFVTGRYGATGGVTHTENENLDVLTHRSAGGLQTPFFVVLTICDEQHDFIGFGFGIKSSQTGFNGCAQVGSRYRDDTRLQHIQKHLKGSIIQGEGALTKGRACKHRQTHAISFNNLEKIDDFPRGPFQTIRFYVFYHHTSGYIHQHHDVHAFTTDFLIAASPAGSGQGKNQAAQG